MNFGGFVYEIFAWRATKGASLKLRVADPNGFLLGFLNKLPGLGLVIGARTPSGFLQPTNLVSADDGGQNLEMLLPIGTAVNLNVFSQIFQFADPNGTQLGSGNPYSVMIPTNQSFLGLTFTVTGHN